MKKSRKNGVPGRTPLTEAEVEALCALPDAEFAAQRREAFPEEAGTEMEIEEIIVSEQIAHDRAREENGGWLGESYAHEMTPEEEAEANRIVDEAIEADRLAAEGR